MKTFDAKYLHQNLHALHKWLQMTAWFYFNEAVTMDVYEGLIEV